jgi:hypothetical protein
LISSASTSCPKIGPLLSSKRLRPALVLDDDVGADDVAGHQVRRELDAREAQLHRLRERAHEERLAEAGRALEQRVTAREETDEHLLDDLRLPDDDARDSVLQRRGGLRELVDAELGDASGLRFAHGMSFLSCVPLGALDPLGAGPPPPK